MKSQVICRCSLNGYAYRAVFTGTFVHIERAEKDAMGDESWTMIHTVNVINQPHTSVEKILAHMLARSRPDLDAPPDNYREG